MSKPFTTGSAKRDLHTKPTASGETAQLWVDCRLFFSSLVPRSGTYSPIYHRGCISPASRNIFLYILSLFPQLRGFTACSGFRIDVSRRDTLKGIHGMFGHTLRHHIAYIYIFTPIHPLGSTGLSGVHILYTFVAARRRSSSSCGVVSVL